MPPKQSKKLKYTQRKRGAKIPTKMDGDGMDKLMDELSSSSSDESSTDDELVAKTSKTPAKSKQQHYKKAAVTFESSTTSRKNKNTVGSKGESDSDDELYAKAASKKAAAAKKKQPRRVKRKKPTTAKKVPPNKNTTKGKGSNGSNKKGNNKIAASSNSDDEDDSTLSSGEDSSSSNKDSGEDDVYALDESDSARLTHLKRLLLVNTAMDAAYSALPANKQTKSTITLVDNKFVKHADIHNDENYNHRFITTIEDRLKNGGNPLYVILDGGDDHSQSGRVGLVCSFEDDDEKEKKVKVKFDVDGDGDGEMATYPITDLWHMFECFNCGGKKVYSVLISYFIFHACNISHSNFLSYTATQRYLMVWIWISSSMETGTPLVSIVQMHFAINV